MADVEEDAPRAGLEHARFDLAVRIDDAERVSVVAVRHDVAGAHQLHHLVRLGGRKAYVGHQRQHVLVAQLPRDLQEVEAVPAVHVGADLYLHAQDDVAVLHRGLARAAHPAADVVDRRNVRIPAARVEIDVAEDARFRGCDDEPPEAFDLVVAEASGVDPGGHARARGDRVRLDSEPRGSEVAMRVQVDQPRRHVRALRVDRLDAARRGDVGLDGGDLAVSDAEGGAAAQLLAGIAQLAAPDHDIVAFLRGPCGRCAGGKGAEERPSAHRCGWGHTADILLRGRRARKGAFGVVSLPP